MQVKSISARSILDSRKQKTIEVTVNQQKASAPYGKSTGIHETPPYKKSLEESINDINNLDLSVLEINNFSDLKKLESLLRKKFKLNDVKKFGANALMALEISVLKALAKDKKQQLWQVINPKARKLPIPLGNVLEGGLHAHNKEKPVFQEFLIIPNVKSHNIKLMNSIYNKLKSPFLSNTKSDEGAWQSSLNEEQIFTILSKFKNIKIGTDVAASAFYKKKNYKYKNKVLDRNSQIHYISYLQKKYNILYIEDPLEEEDFSGFAKISRSPKHLIVGDDLTATQIPRLRKAINTKAINAMIVKPNQNGSLIELQKIFKICKKNNIKTALSHRSGETLDSAIADLAFGFQADFIKAGISTKWREAKLKRLQQIERSIN